MKPKLKICGITLLEDARFCAAAGAHFLGFIQFEGSPRFIRPEAAREIIDWLHGPQSVGVFVNESAETVNRVADEVGFDIVQLHGTEPPELCERIERPVIKSIPVVHDASAEQLRVLMSRYEGVVDYWLLDTHRTSLWGGTGESFNWRLARELGDEFPLFLAGGIHAGNLREAAQTMRPYAVDLASGVESSPGVKDFDKLQLLFEAYERLDDTVPAGTDSI